jgi:uncharacterized protein YaaR (DUF327 family)
MEILPIKSSRTSSRTNRVIVIPNGGGSIFARELMKVEAKNHHYNQQELERLMKNLEYAGAMLEEAPSVATYMAFRELIGKFAKAATTTAYRVEKITSTCGPWNYEVVATINKEADLLYHMVMQRQLNRVAIASRLASIKGMIIELIA